MTDVSGFGGHRKIYEDLVKRLENADIATLARHVNLPINTVGEVEVPFLGATYLISIQVSGGLIGEGARMSRRVH